ncbi:MAG: tetratricopeptide repeat protein, partial [Enterobacterales bacterium]|nr:tetratricopeptide repeat protein [Enterobacterales bacterium]
MKNNKARLPLQRLGLTGICLLSLPWLASAAGGENSAVLSQLFNQAQYWHERGHPDDAKSVLKKVLSVDPNNAEALYLLALYSLQQGNKTESSKWKQQLQQVSPDSG